MDYTKLPLSTEITINLKSLNTEQALFLASFLKGKNKTALHLYFKNTLFFPFSDNVDIRKEQIKAHPLLLKLMKLAEKYNQRDGWWLEDQSPITHEKHPHNNLQNVIVVENNKIKIKNRTIKDLRYYLEFMDHGKYKGNIQHFIKTYHDDILKTAPFLAGPIKVQRFKSN